MPEIRTVTTLRRKRDEISASIRVDEKKIAQTPRPSWPRLPPLWATGVSRRCGRDHRYLPLHPPVCAFICRPRSWSRGRCRQAHGSSDVTCYQPVGPPLCISATRACQPYSRQNKSDPRSNGPRRSTTLNLLRRSMKPLFLF